MLLLIVVLHYAYMSSLCRTLCCTAYVCVEREPICHWGSCTSAKQYLVSGFNYRYAMCVYIYETHESWGLLSSILSIVSNPSAVCYTLFSLCFLFSHVFFCHVLLSALLSWTCSKCTVYLQLKSCFTWGLIYKTFLLQLPFFFNIKTQSW